MSPRKLRLRLLPARRSRRLRFLRLGGAYGHDLLDHGVELLGFPLGGEGDLVAGGLDRLDAGDGILEFIDQSQIPLLTINLLQALPRTPLYDRLKREGRLIEDADRDSNVDFILPYEHVVSTWRECMARAYTPEKLFARFEHQVRETYPHRLQPPNSKQRLSWRNIKRGMTMLSNIIWHVGVKSDYRREFWKFAWPRLKTGDIERVISVGLVAHHLIVFARDASSGQQNASYYSTRLRDMPVAAE